MWLQCVMHFPCDGLGRVPEYMMCRGHYGGGGPPHPADSLDFHSTATLGNFVQIQLKAYHINASVPYFALSVSRSKNILAGPMVLTMCTKHERLRKCAPQT
jgi:hypothetical protein